MARKEKLPRIYITGNSGARLGLANEVKESFKVKWIDEKDPKKGFKYLYLDKEQYEKIKQSVIAELITDLIDNKQQEIYKIIDVIGIKDGIGVENLRGSGLIAGETSRAYQDVFTISYVSSRTVGIGAYLVRLGQRIIQHKTAPIILTGAPALNKLLGRDVYTSNQQIGGIQIMHNNGVTHLVVQDDFKGILQTLKWLSFVPKRSDLNIPILPSFDPIDREIEYIPDQNKQYDPRNFIAGIKIEEPLKTNININENNGKNNIKWVSGFFDKDSFIETLSGWAKSVVTGRARLGGIPIGVIAVETRSTQQIIPADPGNSSSQEQVIQKAGCVWYPDSAYKTAQAINDFNYGEKLPLIIFANWRGFSGGQRDLYMEILKYGSYIVDALRDFKQPVFIYLIPYGELRGGAWVVVDPTINDEVMEFYSDPTSKGGILEPKGVCEIKFKKND
jgi:acetyl-CoA carboxylase/biotin carboxylase 1